VTWKRTNLLYFPLTTKHLTSYVICGFELRVHSHLFLYSGMLHTVSKLGALVFINCFFHAADNFISKETRQFLWYIWYTNLLHFKEISNIISFSVITNRRIKEIHRVADVKLKFLKYSLMAYVKPPELQFYFCFHDLWTPLNFTAGS
jgi:hypothetical protein